MRAHESKKFSDLSTDTAGTAASSSLAFLALPQAGDTFTLGVITYTFVAAITGDDQILIGASIAATILNAVAAINAGAGAGTVYSANIVAANPLAGAAVGSGLHLVDTAPAVITPSLLATASFIGLLGNEVDLAASTTVRLRWGDGTHVTSDDFMTGGVDAGSTIDAPGAFSLNGGRYILVAQADAWTVDVEEVTNPGDVETGVPPTIEPVEETGSVALEILTPDQTTWLEVASLDDDGVADGVDLCPGQFRFNVSFVDTASGTLTRVPAE